MRALVTLTAAGAALLGLAGCGEKPQDLAAEKFSAPSHKGTVAPGFVSGGWKAGDAQSWEEHMRTRAQAQNEYARAATN